MTDLTILLITKNRYYFLKRWLDFANLNKFKSNIFIADGSSDLEFKKTNLDLNNYKNLNIKYKKYNEDKSYSDMYVKVLNALMKIKTKYSVWADDDDFFFEKGLYESIKFLNSNKKYSSCRKLTGDFDIKNLKSNNNKYGKIRDQCFHNYPTFNNQVSSENDNIFKRLENYTNKKNFTWYDVHKTEHMIFLWKTIKKCNFQNILLTECTLDFLNVISGKLKRFSNISDTLYLLRQYPPKESVAKNFRKVSGDTLDQFFHESWSYEYNTFVNTIASIIKKKTGSDEEFCKKFTANCFRNYYRLPVYLCFDKIKIKNKNKILQKYLIIFYKYLFRLLFYKEKIMSKFSKKNKFNEFLTFNNFFNQIKL